MSQKLQAIYFEAPLKLDCQVRDYLTNIHALLNLEDGKLTSDNPHLKYILDAAENDLLVSLDAVVSEYQRESDTEFFIKIPLSKSFLPTRIQHLV
jgi:two-component system, NtrC family, sensor kinase